MLSPYQKDLSGKVAVITGGSGILCFPMAKMLCELGAKVAILGINEAEFKQRENELDPGWEMLMLNCNVLDRNSLMEAKTTINERFGLIDYLINGAGGNHPKGTTDNEMLEKNDLDQDLKTFFDLEMDGFKFVMDLNFVGTVLPCQVFAVDMVDRKECSIINISSMNGFTPLTKIPAYSGAKAAVSNFTEWLATYFAHVNIRVNAIAPGFFVTAQNQRLLFNDDDTPTARTEKILRNTPMNRFGEAEELLGTILFLLDENCSSFITGVVIPIDGGFNAYSGV